MKKLLLFLITMNFYSYTAYGAFKSSDAAVVEAAVGSKSQKRKATESEAAASSSDAAGVEAAASSKAPKRKATDSERFFEGAMRRFLNKGLDCLPMLEEEDRIFYYSQYIEIRSDFERKKDELLKKGSSDKILEALLLEALEKDYKSKCDSLDEGLMNELIARQPRGLLMQGAYGAWGCSFKYDASMFCMPPNFGKGWPVTPHR